MPPVRTETPNVTFKWRRGSGLRCRPPLLREGRRRRRRAPEQHAEQQKSSEGETIAVFEGSWQYGFNGGQQWRAEFRTRIGTSTREIVFQWFNLTDKHLKVIMNMGQGVCHGLRSFRFHPEETSHGHQATAGLVTGATLEIFARARGAGRDVNDDALLAAVQLCPNLKTLEITAAAAGPNSSSMGYPLAVPHVRVDSKAAAALSEARAPLLTVALVSSEFQETSCGEDWELVTRTRSFRDGIII
ncbi:hypothetical protein B0T26DRAFT_745530 [Lasiosphaeria miniovina]|uniref:Uncharacterized protein n=1 Tax=Lasiosphaeria miniovina TaxID=1954250 RepID=A0AA40BFW3_9PEZI|nr:uncharacterized protein B0T26DRAFT_745530 [Lasiosphaeria miniovina]KAK0733494.1 hypothetical protein B0T26DRAFT_745530 [Lasiosphaeria miniovina]